MTADQDLSARLDAMKEPALQYDSVQDEFHAALDAAYRSGQLITVADHERAVQAAVAKAVEAEREACADVAVNRHWHWGKLGNACLVDDDASACADIAAAIRSRGVAG